MHTLVWYLFTMDLYVGQINLNKCRVAIAELNWHRELSIVLITELNSFRNRVVGLEPSGEIHAMRNCNPQA